MGEISPNIRFVPDRKGMLWDLLLYVPTVAALASIGAKLWYGGDKNLAYLLCFLASFFLIAGSSRILKTRLMLLPSAPVALELNKQYIRLEQRDGKVIDLVKEQRFYSDYSGRSFGISGLDGRGERLQFVFHKGQFQDASQYDGTVETLRRYFK